MGNKSGKLSEEHLSSLSKATGSSLQDISLMQENFFKLDKDDKGFVTKKDLLEKLSSPNLEEKAFAGKLLDLFGDGLSEGRLNFSELVVALSEFRSDTNSGKLRLLFNLIDSDGNGKVGAKELEEAFKLVKMEHITKQDLAEIAQQTLAYADADKDGLISFEEFKEFFNTVLQITI